MTAMSRSRHPWTAVVALLAGCTTATTACGGQAAPRATGSTPTTEAATTAATATGRPLVAEEWPITACGTYSGTGCAPVGSRVDLTKPAFSDPTSITNPLFPISRSRSVIQLGHVGDELFRSESTLLPYTGTIDWDGKQITVVLVQYLAYRGGMIEEAAIDRYAQADDGAVWYLGEDVFDYADGAITETAGTWLAGRDGPPAMIMPAHPNVGDAFRSENVGGVVFEEMRVKAVGQTVAGPAGPVPGAIVLDELGLEGDHAQKIVAPGYGEFRTTSDGELEAVAVAAPTDSLQAPLPAALRSLTTGAWGVAEDARTEDWDAASQTVTRMKGYWARLRAMRQPPMVAIALDAALRTLTGTVAAEEAEGTLKAAVDVAQASLDLEQRYLPVGAVDVERVHLHTQQLRIHAAAGNRTATLSEVAGIEWTVDRLGLPTPARAEIDTRLRALRAAVEGAHLQAAADHAARLAARLRTLAQGTADRT